MLASVYTVTAAVGLLLGDGATRVAVAVVLAVLLAQLVVRRSIVTTS